MTAVEDWAVDCDNVVELMAEAVHVLEGHVAVEHERMPCAPYTEVTIDYWVVVVENV